MIKTSTAYFSGNQIPPLSGINQFYTAALVVLLFLVFTAEVMGQPTKQWDKTIGGSGTDELKSVQQTADGGYILGGSSESKASGDKSEDSGYSYYGDYWVVKLNAAGVKEWDRTLGGINSNTFTAVCQTADGGYIVAGNSLSNAGRDKTENSKGLNDYWIIKLDASGKKIWDKTIGSPSDDLLWSLKATKDGGCILGGETQGMVGGDKSPAPNQGYDFWVVKLDAQGNKQWDKTIGGNGYDILRSIDLTFDGGYILGGLSTSEASGDKTENSKAAGSTYDLAGYDYWVVKLNASGLKEWDKTLGGNALDDFRHVIQTKDGGYIVGGESFSGISGDKSEISKGGRDFWLVKLNAIGNKVWDKTMGGTNDEYLRALHQTIDGGFVLSGSYKSLLKFNTSGNIEWEKSISGGSSFVGLDQTADGGFILGNSSISNANGDKSEDSKGGSDYWVVKLWFPPVPPPTISTNNLTTSEFCAGNSFSVSFSTTGTFAPGEVFKVQLSSASSSFVSPIIIGSGTSSPIIATIPSNSVSSAKYKIRVVSSSSPVIIGTESKDDVAISNPDASLPLNIQGTSLPCQGGVGYYMVSNTNGYTNFSWAVPSGWTITSGQGTEYITVSVGESGGPVSVRSKSPCGNDVIGNLDVQTVVKPSPPIVFAGSTCGSGTVTLTASGAPSTGSYRWYTNSSGVTLVGSFATYTTHWLTASATYYVSIMNGSCESALVPVTATINPLPVVGITASSTTITAGSSATLTATGATSYVWSPATGLSSTTGATITATPSATTTYKVTGSDAYGCSSAASVTIMVETSAPTCSARGSILREYWANISSTSVSAIPVNTAPTSTAQLTSFESPSNVADNYGQRIRGFICAPTTGSYTFYIAGDDDSELWLSTSDNAANKQKIASVSGWTYSKEWNKYPTQKSVTIQLQANNRYYIEALHKEGAGGDNLAVGWVTPGTSAIAVIPGSVLSPAITAATNQPPTVSITAPASGATFTAPAGFTINTHAADVDGMVNKVEFYNGGQKLGEDLTAPYSFTWSNVAAGTFSLTAKATDYSGNVTTSSIVSVTVNAATASCSATGTILREYWANISGTSVSTIPVQNSPTSTSQLTSFEAATNVGDNYGQRIRGFICAPTTGSYTFYIAGDDDSELWLSSDSDPVNKQRIAHYTGWTYVREWNKYATQKSVTIQLQANTRYYIEALHKEATGGDNLAVGWITPDNSAIVVIPGSVLSPVITTTTPNQPPTVSLTSPATGTNFPAPATINLSANATDGDGSVNKVEFFQGTLKLSEDLTAPYTYTWSNVAAGTYPLTVKATDNSGNSTTSVPVSIVVHAVPVGCTASGTILREYWGNVSGSTVATIPLHTTPTATYQITSFEAPTNVADHYGQRLRGYICAPSTGNYTFYIASDNESELWLSTDDYVANIKLIAAVASGGSAWTAPREWTKYASQKSAVIFLEAGRRYYVEALHKENMNGDNLAVGWITPANALITVIPGSVLSPFTGTTPTPPTVSLTSPVNGATFTAPASMAIAAHAADNDGSIAKVEFFSGATKLGEDLSAPYTYSWTGVVAGTYSLTAKATDNAGLITTSAAVLVEVKSATASCSASGNILREYWANIGGNLVSAIPVNTTPTATSQLPSFESPLNVADNYGQRIRGFICAPATGSYTFFIAGDDDSELWFSTSDNAANKQKIASVSGWTNSREWSKYPTQKSITFLLQANTKYYIEALHKEAAGGDNLAVGWTTPGTSTIAIIPGSVLSPVTNTTSAALATSKPNQETEPYAGSGTVFRSNPNPFHQKALIEFSFAQDETYQVEIYNASGALVKAWPVGKAKANSLVKLEWANDKLPVGVYLVRLVSKDKVQALRVVRE